MEDNFIEKSNGMFGQFGGAFIPEILKPIFDRINLAFLELLLYVPEEFSFYIAQDLSH